MSGTTSPASPAASRSSVPTAIESVHLLAAVAAIAAPALIASNRAPSATFLNQAAALVGWGVWLLLVATSSSLRSRVGPMRAGLSSLLSGLALVFVAAVGSWMSGLPASLAWSSGGLVTVAMLTAWMAASLDDQGAEQAFRVMCFALLVAGMTSALLAIIQIFVPSRADGEWIAATFNGRAAGNLRQPNHLSSLLLWALIAGLWLFESGRLCRGLAVPLVAIFVFAIVLTGSRTGLAGVVLLALWGLVDRRLSRATRTMLLLTPLVYLLCWAGASGWAHWSHESVSGESHIIDTTESANSRLKIWANTLSLIAQHPWLGVGFGEFNFAWSLTPFPGRPTAFFDHTHNLPLQLLVELGIPLATVVMALFAYALWRAFAASAEAAPPRAATLRCAFMMVLMILMHSMFEYPLWYAYFMLPAAFMWGLCLGGSKAEADAAESGGRPFAASRGAMAHATVLACALVVAGGIGSVWDYLRVSAIFESDDPLPLADRIARGEHSWFFAHHAYYAAATVAAHPSEEMQACKVATHYLLDTRIMMAWANALHEAGDDERARFIAQRLREFANDDSLPFFAACDKPVLPDAVKPFQCTPPTKSFGYRDFE